MIWVRSALFAAYFHGFTLLLLLPGTLVRLLAPGRSDAVARLWARGTIAGLRVICGVRYRVTGAEHLPRGAGLIASRHESAFDTFVWLILLPRCRYVVKQELVRIPLLGALIPLAGMIVVDRAGGTAAMRGLLRDAARVAAEDRPIVIFPEGTRVTPGQVAPLQPGVAAIAAALGAATVPVATDSGRFWPRRGFLISPGTIRIAVRPPLPAGLNRLALLARLAAEIAGPPVDNSVS